MIKFIADIGCNWKISDLEEENWNNIVKIIDELYETDDITYVLFEAWNTESFISHNHPNYMDYFKQYELPIKFYSKIKELVESKGMKLLVTPYDIYTINKLTASGINNFYISNHDLDYKPMLDKISKVAKELYVGTCNTTLTEIEDAHRVIKENYNGILTFIHSINKYPSTIDNGDFYRLEEIRHTFPGTLIGYSGHSNIGDALILTNTATAMGVTTIVIPFKTSGITPDTKYSFSLKETTYLIESNKTIHNVVNTSSSINLNEANWGRRNPYTGKRPIFLS